MLQGTGKVFHRTLFLECEGKSARFPDIKPGGGILRIDIDILNGL